MGFLFTSLVFFRRKSRPIAYAGGAFGLVYGSALGVARIVQGGHYPSDVLWSLGVILSVATVLYFFVLRIPDHESQKEVRLTGTRKHLAIACLAVLIVALSLIFLTRRPFYETYEKRFRPNYQTAEIRVKLNAPLEAAVVQYRSRDDGLLLFHVSGFGWVRAELGFAFQERSDGNAIVLSGDSRPRGYFSELNHRAEIFLPKRFEDRFPVHFVSSNPVD